MTFSLERPAHRARAFRIGLAVGRRSAFGVIQLGLSAGAGFDATAGWRSQLHPGAAGLGEADGDGLLGVPRAMFAFANMVHFFPHKLPGLGGGSFSFSFILVSTSQSFYFRHIGFCGPGFALEQVG